MWCTVFGDRQEIGNRDAAQGTQCMRRGLAQLSGKESKPIFYDVCTALRGVTCGGNSSTEEGDVLRVAPFVLEARPRREHNIVASFADG